MASTTWWDAASPEYKERAVRVLNREVFSLGSVELAGLPDFERYQRGLLTGDEFRAFRIKRRTTWQPIDARRDQLSAIVQWRSSAALPPDVRRCRYKRCARFFLVSKSRPDRAYCNRTCGRNYRALKSMNAKKQGIRERKLKRVRNALKAFRGIPDWKERTARRARVTPNFISYALRRGEIKRTGQKGDRKR